MFDYCLQPMFHFCL